MGHKVTLVAPRPQRALCMNVAPGVQLTLTPDSTRLGLPRAGSAVLMIPAVLRLRKSNVLYLRSSPGTLLLALLARLKRFRWLVVECNSWLADDTKLLGVPSGLSKIVCWLQVAEMRLGDKVRVVTPNLRKLVCENGVAAKNTAIIGNGTDTEIFRPLDRLQCRRSLGLDPRSRVIAFVGNLWPAIDLATVFEALSLLRERETMMRLVVVGDGVGRRGFERMANHFLGADSGVQFLGSISPEATNEALNAADVAIAPFTKMRNERTGLAPLKLCDYASVGLPCVASAIAGVTELGSEPWMFLAEPENPQSFALALIRALSADKAVIGVEARAYALRHFQWGRVASDISAICQESRRATASVRHEVPIGAASTSEHSHQIENPIRLGFVIRR